MITPDEFDALRKRRVEAIIDEAIGEARFDAVLAKVPREESIEIIRGVADDYRACGWTVFVADADEMIPGRLSRPLPYHGIRLER